MFRIENANISLLGRYVTYYAVTPIWAAIVITAVNCLLAKRKKLDTSFVFRLSAVVFSAAALGQLYFHALPTVFLPFLYLMSTLGVTLVFWVAGRFFKQGELEMLGLGVCSVSLFSAFSKLGCFLTGCCYGKPYEGPLRVVYGRNTENPFPETGRFPIQLVMVLLFLGLSVVAYGIFIRHRSYQLQFALLFSNWFLYYIGTCLYDQRANQMIIAGFNFALPLAGISFCGVAVSWGFYLKKSLKKGEM